MHVALFRTALNVNDFYVALCVEKRDICQRWNSCIGSQPSGRDQLKIARNGSVFRC